MMFSRPTKWLMGIVSAVVLAFLYAPLVIIMVQSLNRSENASWPPRGLTGKWWGKAWENQGWKDSLWLSVRVALAATLIALVLGTLASMAVHRFKFFGREAISFVVLLPIALPGIVTGIALRSAFDRVDVQRGYVTVVIAHATFSMCFAAVVVQARLYDFDKSVEEAAMDLGATHVGTFFQVTLPIIAPSVISAWLLSFTLSLDDLVIASFTTGPGATTLPMKIYSQVRLGVTPEINAVSTIMIGLVTVGVLVASYSTKRASQQQEKETKAVDAGAH